MSKPQSLATLLCDNTLATIVEALRLQETYGESGGPWMRLESQIPVAKGEVGRVRRFVGKDLFQLVHCSIVVPAMQMDSHMLFAFTPANSILPHFTLDSVKAGEHFAFHLDLIPKVDLAANLAYMNEVYQPLTEVCQASRQLEGLSEAKLSPRQLALMSPWMLANRASEAAFSAIESSVKSYRDHWLALISKGISKQTQADTECTQMALRDKRNKAALFNPDVDPVWNQIEGLIGGDSALELRQLLARSE